MNNILSLSGGKDSTAMLLEMLERGEDIHSVVFFDTGWEFPQMYNHIEQLEKYTGLKIWRLHPTVPLEYWLTRRPIKARKTRQVYRFGYGWASFDQRWCTKIKTDALDLFSRPIAEAVQCVGYASDEPGRNFSRPGVVSRFPLQEYGITEAAALNICKRHGFTWGGLYDRFKRVSCYCCPFKQIDEYRTIRMHFPELWTHTLNMDAAVQGTHVFDELEQRFKEEDRQIHIFQDEPNQALNRTCVERDLTNQTLRPHAG